MSNQYMQAFPEVDTVLLVSPFDEDRLNLRSVLRHSNLQPYTTRTLAEAMEYLRENATPVVICEGDLSDGTWKDLLSQFARMECPPLLVVTSRFADERLWSEVLNMGAYNVLAKPLSAKEVLYVLGLACEAWKHSWQMPRALACTA
ncbi:MAG TPA: hypothetical protein VKR61_17710 [Bryobacteraceae bacterium]|nr:hypothetical protein [Bryobacteraceae bacterium]